MMKTRLILFIFYVKLELGYSPFSRRRSSAASQRTNFALNSLSVNLGTPVLHLTDIVATLVFVEFLPDGDR
jgi:hypothetical protein